MKPLKQRLFIILGTPVILTLFILPLYYLFVNMFYNSLNDLVFAVIPAVFSSAGIVFVGGMVIYGAIILPLCYLLFGDMYKFDKILIKLYVNDWKKQIAKPKKKQTYYDKRYETEDAEWQKKYDEVMGKLNE